MKVVCLDTQTIIWGIKKESSPGQEGMIAKAEHLIHELEKQQVKVIVPALVLAELMMPIHESRYGHFLSSMNRRFRIIPFDTSAAARFATLWKKWRDKHPNDGKKKRQPTRAEMKTDFMIVATAISRKAECIYSEDTDIIKFAKGHLDVRSLPPIIRQGRLL
ncbi:MAG: PIN domain-containing protein [Cyanobacteria bacterium P01_H01_bin.21]